MKKSRQLVILLLILVAIAETAFVGCGGSGDSNSFDEVSRSISTIVSNDAKADKNGKFSVATFSTNVSYVSASALEENTIAPNTDITLSARASLDQKIGVFNNYNTQIYKLTAVNSDGGSSIFNSKQEITTVNKPITITINQLFPPDATNFYMGARSSSRANWQFTKLSKEFSRVYTNNNKSGDYSATSRMAVKTDDIYFTFSITTYRLGEEITIVYDSDGSSGTLATGTPSINSVIGMTFATDLPYLDLKFNEAGEYVYNTDLVFTTCIEASNLGSLFSGATAKTIVTFLTDSNKIIDSLQIVGNTTKFANQTVSATRDGAGDKYTHTITFDDYPNPSRGGRMATYTFTLKVRDVLLSEFPEKVLVKTIFTDTTPITYSAEANLTREMLLSYLAAVSPVINDGEVPVGSNLVMKYIAHDIASVTVKYTYPGLSESVEMPGSFAKDADNNLLTFYPGIPWPSNQTITASASAFCCTPHGANGISTCQFNFKTGDTGSGPIIIGTDTYDPVTVSMQSPYPTDDVDPYTDIVLEFSDDIAWEDSYTSVLKLASGTHPMQIATPTFDAAAKTITFRPIENFRYNASYTLIFEGLADPVNKKYISLCDFAFGTSDGAHGTATIVASDSSVVDGQLIAQPTFVIDFGKDICKSDYINQNKLEYAFEAIKVYKGLNIVPIGNLDKHWVELYHKMELSFKVPLEASETYHITMDDDVLDFENVTITPFEPYYFGVLPDITSELVIPASPIDVDINTNLAIQFSHPIDWISSYSKSINLFIGREEIPTHNYVYASDTSTVTFEPKEPMLYNASYVVLIAPNLYNASTMQHIASNAFYFETCDTDHLKATAKLTDASKKPDGKAIIKPTVEIDFGARVLNYNAAIAAIRLKKNGVEISITPYAVWKNTYQVLELTYTLEPNTDYVLTMDEGLRVFDGKYTDPFDELAFTTADDITATLTTPAGSPVADPPANLVLTFSDDIAWSNSEDDKKVFYLERGREPINSNLNQFVYATDTRTLTISLKEALFYNASYTLGIDDGLVNSITGQKIATASFYFEISDAPHQQATIAFTDGVSTTDKAAIKPTLTVDFGKAVMNENDTADTIRLYKKDEPENILTGCYIRKWPTAKNKVELKFTSALLPETEYIIKMESSPKDYQGIPIDPFADFEFKTMSNLSVAVTEPADLTAAPVDTRIVLQFSDSISWNEADDADKVRIWFNGEQLAKKKYVYSDANKTLTITMKENFLNNATYTIRVEKGLINTTTGQETVPTEIGFRTTDGTHDKATIEMDPASIVDGEAILRPTIYIDMKKAVLNADLLKVKEAVRVFNGTTEVNTVQKTWATENIKMKLTFLSDSLEPHTTYKVTMDEGIRNYLGVYIDPFDDFEFTTQNMIGVNLVSPANITSAPIDTEIKVGFTNPVDWIDGERNKFTLKIGDTVIAFADENAFTYNSADNTVTIKTKEPLLYNTTYTLAVKKGIKNNTTQQITEAQTFEFTTTDGLHSQAVLIVSEADKVNDLLTTQDQEEGAKDMLVVTPSFIVDFCKTVSNEATAINSIKLFEGDTDVTRTSQITKAWVGTNKRQLQLKFDGTIMLKSHTIYKITMSESVPDVEGAAIEPFEDYIFVTTPNGTGTEADPFHIYTPAQLDSMRKNMQCFYALKKDINIATSTYTSETNSKDYGWTPIGNTDTSFGNGNKAAGLDGNGHKIIGLSINRPTSTKSVGLFGRTVNAKLRNIIFEDCKVIGEEAVGCLVGMANTTEINRCAAESSCLIKGVSYVGGICGTCYSTTVSKCRNSAKVTSSGATGDSCGTGGIVGWNNVQSRISSCYNNGQVIAVDRPCGGITGFNNANVNNCGNDKEAYVESNKDTGGIVGKNANSGKVDKSLAFGNIVVTNLASLNIGGIAGSTDESAIICNNVITNATYLNSSACTTVEQVVYGYVEGERIYNNQYFGSLEELYRGAGDTSLWKDGECFDSNLWVFQQDAFPTVKDLP